MSYYVGIDIGGTFTDAVLLDDAGVARLLKTPTTLDEPARGVNNALALAESELGMEPGTLLSQVDYFGLGTTVATNALIERKGVKTGIITTQGFRDTLLIQRGMGHLPARSCTRSPASPSASIPSRWCPASSSPRSWSASTTRGRSSLRSTRRPSALPCAASSTRV